MESGCGGGGGMREGLRVKPPVSSPENCALSIKATFRKLVLIVCKSVQTNLCDLHSNLVRNVKKPRKNLNLGGNLYI